MMTTKHGGSYNQGVKLRIQSITIPYMKQDLHGFEDYKDLVWFLSADQVTTFIATTTAKDSHEIKEIPRLILLLILEHWRDMKQSTKRCCNYQ